MRLINQTPYPTRLLRSLICAVHTAEAKGGRGRRLPRWSRLTIKIAIRRAGNRDYTGHAYLSGHYSHLSVPPGGLDVAAFAALWRHELWHLYGIRHGDFPESIMWCQPTAQTAAMVERFGATIPEPAPPPAPSALSRSSANIAKAQRDMARASERAKRLTTKAKRTATALAKAKRDLKRAVRAIGRHSETHAELLTEGTEARAARPVEH